MVGLKVLGVVTIIIGLIQMIVQWGSLPAARGPGAFWMVVTCIVIPFIYLAVGLYLLLGTRGLAERLWPDGENDQDWVQVVFQLAMKIVGVVLVVRALPDLVRIIGNTLYVYSAGPVWDTSWQRREIYQTLLPSLLRLLLGWYLLFKGAWLQKVAFPESDHID